MTEIEELIEQAKAVLRKWRLPRYDEPEKGTPKPWQKVMDDRLFTDHAGPHH